MDKIVEEIKLNAQRRKLIYKFFERNNNNNKVENI